MLDSCQRAVDTLRSLGAEIVAIEIPHLRSLQVAHGLVVSAEISTILGEARPRPETRNCAEMQMAVFSMRLLCMASFYGNHPRQAKSTKKKSRRGFVAQQAPTGAIHPHPVRLGHFDGRGGNSVREHGPRLGRETHPPGADGDDWLVTPCRSCESIMVWYRSLPYHQIGWFMMFLDVAGLRQLQTSFFVICHVYSYVSVICVKKKVINVPLYAFPSLFPCVTT